jgi:hypothetical protein
MDPLDPILAGLTPPQAEAAMHDGAILVLAGAGTGKPAPHLGRGMADRLSRHSTQPCADCHLYEQGRQRDDDRIRGMLPGRRASPF